MPSRTTRLISPLGPGADHIDSAPSITSADEPDRAGGTISLIM